MKNSKFVEQEIRELLGRWYAGGTSAEDERRLATLLAEAETLPGDLEADRALFSAIGEEMSGEVEMPPEYSARIGEALQKEIDRETAARFRRMRFRRLAGIAGAAVILLAVWTGTRFISGNNDTDGDISSGKFARNEVRTPQVDPVVKPLPAPEQKKEHSVIPSRSSASANLHGKKRPAPTVPGIKKEVDPAVPVHSPYPADGESGEDILYLSREEEERLMAANYRVIDNEYEALATVNSTFSRIEGNIAEENFRIEEIYAQYRMQVDKLYN